MPASAAKTLSSVFRSAIKTTFISSEPSLSALSALSDDATLKHILSSSSSPSPSTSISHHITKRSSKPSKSSSRPKKSSCKPPASSSLPKLNISADSASELSKNQLSQDISSILCGDIPVDSSNSHGTIDEKFLDKVLNIPWFSNLPHKSATVRRKVLSRERKQKWVFKSSEVHRFDRLVRMCAQKLGTDATLRVFGKLGRETGLKEYNALIRLCVETAKTTDDEEVALDQIYKAFQLFKSLKEQGFQLEEETYGQFFMYLIDMGMIEEFKFFCQVIKDEKPSSVSRLGYYEMLLWIRVNDEGKIQELCDYIAANDGEEFNLQENYLLALFESDRKKELLQLLEVIDITKVSSSCYVESIFKSLGRLSLESFAEKFLLTFKNSDNGADNVSDFILSYATGVPNLAVEDAVLKFKNLHSKLEMTPSSASCEKLIEYCCDSFKVHVALDIVDQMYEGGLTVSIETIHSILHASEESYEFNLVQRIYSLICCHNLKPNSETFRSMISLSVRMKDYDSAYAMLKDLGKMNLTPTASMYNSIMAGFFREKNIEGGKMVLRQMEQANVKPDSQTFSYLIINCNREEDIIKYYEDLKHAGIQITKQIFMSLINAYATCGQFEKAKEVLLDKGIPVKSLNEVKSVLVAALASHGQMSDALDLYEEIKQAGCNLEPKTAISLIEHLQDKGNLSKLLQLLEELNDPDYWTDGCCRVILYCVRYKHLRSAVDLLQQLKEKFSDNEIAMEVLFDELFSLIADSEPTHLQFGLQLLQVIKDDFGLSPSRKCLDFLLGACVKAKDLSSSRLVWREYHTAGLPYNVLSYVRMYQALLASNDYKSAKKILKKIPQDDPHVCCVVKACQIYIKAPSLEGDTKEKNKKKK